MQGRSQKFVSERGKTETGDISSPAGSRDRALVGVWGLSPEAEDIYANSHCNNVLTKNP